MATQDTCRYAEELFAGIWQEDVRKVESLLSEHPELVNVKSPTKFGIGMTTPLMEACLRVSMPMVKLLLKNYADVCGTGHVRDDNVLGSTVRSEGGYGSSDEVFPLFIAAKKAGVSLVGELFFAGAKVNQINAIGQSALHAAAMTADSHYRTISFKYEQEVTPTTICKIMEHGADVNLQDFNGKTPLHYACTCANILMAQPLLDKGADITVKDNHGLTALQLAAQYDFKIVEALIHRCRFTPEEIIEAYEVAAVLSSSPSPFEILSKATQMRLYHHIPKTVFNPLECHGYIKEWETQQELQRYEHDVNQLRFQSVLARERIFAGKYVDFGKSERIKLNILGGNREQLNALLKHHLNLFCSNNDYLYFTENIACTPLVRTLFCPTLEVENSALSEFLIVAIKSCDKIMETLRIEIRPGTIQTLITQIEQVLFTLGAVMLELLKKEDQLQSLKQEHQSSSDEESDQLQSLKQHKLKSDIKTDLLNPKKLFRELLQKFPSVVCPFSGYRSPLPHVLFNNKYVQVRTLIQNCEMYRKEMMRIVIDAGFDLNSTDSEGNTLLHVIIHSVLSDSLWFQRSPRNIFLKSARNAENVLRILLENGAYLHARNRKRKTVFDILDEPGYKEFFHGTQLKELMKQYDQFPSLKRIAATTVRNSGLPYQNHLPSTLVKFTDLQ